MSQGKVCKINQLGEKDHDGSYICKVCGRQVKTKEAKTEGWHYSIIHSDNSLNFDHTNIKYYASEDVEYVCREHYRTLSKDDAKQFVKVGYPYEESILTDQQNILIF